MEKSEFDDDPLLGPAGFVFQTPVRSSSRGQKPAKADLLRATRLAHAIARIGRVARRPPEVMVKVTGSARGFRAMKEHIAYITRNGKLVAEREDGSHFEGATNVLGVAEEWWDKSNVDRPARARDTINVMLSMPPGTDPQVVADAARAFAQKTFSETFDYVLAHHNRDADPKRPENPHAHLTIRGRGRNGQRLDPRKADLQAWREGFAAELRARGVIAEATPRRTRGVTRKGQRQAIRHMDARRASHVTQWKLMQAIKTVAGDRDEDTASAPWAKAAQERQRKVLRAWNTLAAAFEQAGQPKMAQEVKQFVSTMPPPQTEREHFVAQAGKLLDKKQAKDRGRDN